MARRPLVQGKPPIDLGLRADPKKKNTGWVTLYVGTTKAVDIAVDARGRFSLPFKERALFAAVDPPFDVDWKRPRTLAELAAIAEPLSAHVEAAVQTVTPKYWGEGFLQVAVMRTNGAVAVDREVVPSYHDISTRRAWEKTYQVPLNAARARLAAKHYWASGWKPKGRELDCLAISDAGDLLAIEVKPGSANDLEQTPLQVSFYKQMLDKCVEADMERVRRAVETMARQRQPARPGEHRSCCATGSERDPGHRRRDALDRTCPRPLPARPGST